MATDLLAALKQVLVGRSCVVERAETDWMFVFGDIHQSGCVITASAPWRIVSNGAISHGSADDGHRFGLTEGIDGEKRPNDALGSKRVIACEIDSITADLRIGFAGDVRLDVFNCSSGYEGWQATFDCEGDKTSIIALGGGAITAIR